MGRYQQYFKALGSDVYITLVTDKNQLYADWLFKRLQKYIVDFEKRFSRFLPDSELTNFNNLAGERTLTSNKLHELLIMAKNLAEETKGLYNPFILPALQKAGYVGSWPKPEDFQGMPNFEKRKVVTIDKLTIGETWARIPKNTALDFGGIGKGYLLDELASRLLKEKLTGYWLSLGGDIICSGHDIKNQKWSIAVQSALEPNKNIETIINKTGENLAIATSGVTKRKGINNGENWHHIIDPTTGKPVNTSILTATVTAKEAVIADVYAKCVVIAGAEFAQQYKHKGKIQAFIVQTKEKTNVSKTKKVLI